MPGNRQLHSSALHSAGDTLFVLGGQDDTGVAQSSVWGYDVQKDTWVTYPSLPRTLVLGEAVVLGDTLYAMGGKQDGTTDSTVMSYNLAGGTSGSWDTTAVSGLPTARRNFEAVQTAGGIYAFGGFDGTNLSSVVKYDPSTNSWTSLTSMPVATANHAAVLFNGSVYVAGGFDGAVTDAVHQYDVSSDTWTTETSLPGAGGRFLMGSRAFNKVIIADGSDGTGTVDTVNRARP